MRNIEDEYTGLMSGILHGGKEKADRTGTGTRAVFGRMLYHDMKLGFPILTKKKIIFNNAKTEANIVCTFAHVCVPQRRGQEGGGKGGEQTSGG